MQVYRVECEHCAWGPYECYCKGAMAAMKTLGYSESDHPVPEDDGMLSVWEQAEAWGVPPRAGAIRFGFADMEALHRWFPLADPRCAEAFAAVGWRVVTHTATKIAHGRSQVMFTTESTEGKDDLAD